MAHQIRTLNWAKTHSAPQTFTTTIPLHFYYTLSPPQPQSEWILLTRTSCHPTPAIPTGTQTKCNPSLSALRLHSPLNPPIPTSPIPFRVGTSTEFTGTPTNSLNPMSMFYALKGITEVWDHFLQNNAQGRNGNFHVADYYVVRAVSPYFMLHPTEPSAWFVTWPGTAGRITLQACPGWLQGPHYILRTSLSAHILTLWNFTFTIASSGCPSFTKVATPSTILTLMSSLVTPSLALKILSAPSSPFQTITLLKRVSISPFSPICLIR